MNVPYRIRELEEEAWHADSNGRYVDGALLHEQSYHIARGHGMLALAFELGRRAASCWGIAGELDRKLAILLEILRSPPPDVLAADIFYARASMYEFFVYDKPNLKRAERTLDELERMVLADPTLPHANVPYLRAELRELQGRYAEALELLETSWMEHSPHAYAKYQWALYATRINLRLGRHVAAERWCEILGVTNIGDARSRANWHLMRGHVALFENSVNEAYQRSMDAEDAAAGVQSAESEQRALDLRIRALLLDPSRGDPNSRHHPARKLMARRRAHQTQIDMLFDWKLLRIDYRLATVRHAAGIDPVDDLWYSRAQKVSAQIRVVDRTDLLQRARHVRRAAAFARRYAEQVDGCLESEFRGHEVQARLDRLNEILRAVVEP